MCWHLVVEEAVREEALPRPLEENDLPEDPKLMMELGPELTAPSSLLSAPFYPDVKGWGWKWENCGKR